MAHNLEDIPAPPPEWRVKVGKPPEWLVKANEARSIIWQAISVIVIFMAIVAVVLVPGVVLMLYRVML
jgi:hypothetical protein